MGQTRRNPHLILGDDFKEKRKEISKLYGNGQVNLHLCGRKYILCYVKIIFLEVGWGMKHLYD